MTTESPNALVTGANRGIGLEFCRQLKGRGVRVAALCRAASPELRALGIPLYEGIDVTSDASVDSLVHEFPPHSLDLLINNAGILESNSLADMDWESMRRQFEVNALGPLRVTNALLPALKPGGKVAMITSRMGSIADNSSGGSYGYRMSKAALNAASQSLALDLSGHGISVAILHPGYVKTEMTEGRGLIDARTSVRGLLERIDGLNQENSGTFWHGSGEQLPW